MSVHEPDIEEPPPPEAGGGLLFVLMFWFMLATSIELWWLNTPAHSLSSVGSMFTAAGRVTGMVAGFILLVQVLLMSRVMWLERWMGAHDLLIWHRELGGALVVMVLVHVATIVVGYAAYDRFSLTKEAWNVTTTFPAMISAAIGTGMLVLIGLLSIRTLRRLMSYELWYFTHLTAYVVLLLTYGHQFADGHELFRPGFGRTYWQALYVFVVVAVVWGRIVRPVLFNLRYRFTVADVVPEAADMVSIYITGRKLDRLKVKAGQYFRWRFLGYGLWWQAHPFSLSAAPNSKWLRLTVKIVGDHTDDLQYIEPGMRVFAEGPSGVFTANRRVRPRALLIAGGSGIAPIRALLEELPTRTVVIYRASSEEDLIFREELDHLAAQRSAQVWYVLGSREDPWPKRAFTAKGLRELVPDVRRRDVYLCGPQGIISASLSALNKLHVPKRQIHLDPFEF